MDILAIDEAAADAAAKYMPQKFPIYADFSKYPNGPLTAAESGQPVSMFGTGPAVIVDGKLVHTPNGQSSFNSSYAQIDAGSGRRISRIGALVSWPAGSNGALALVLPNAAWTDASKPASPVHFVDYGFGAWHCSRWNSPGESKYADSESAVGTPEKALRHPAVRDGLPRFVQLELDHSTGEIVFVLPGGGIHRTTTSNILDHTGRWAIFEHFENVGTDTPCVIHAIWADTEEVPVGSKEVTRGTVAKMITQAPVKTDTQPTVKFVNPTTEILQVAPAAPTAEQVGVGVLEQTFIVPPSGAVLVEWSAYIFFSAATSVTWQVVDEGGAVLLSQNVVNGNYAQNFIMRGMVSSMVPGTSRTFRWFHSASVSPGASFHVRRASGHMATMSITPVGAATSITA